jgi:hypothetical protein
LAVTDELAERRRGWAGLGQLQKHRIRRIDLGDRIRYLPTGEVSMVAGIWLDGPYLRALVDLKAGPAWVLSQDCDAVSEGL